MSSLIDFIGNTPIVELKNISCRKNKNKLYGKLEGHNPSGSVKDRIVLRMINDAERKGNISPGDTLIESSSGNTAVSIAMIGKIKGYQVTLVVDPKASKFQLSKMNAFGANIICVDEQDEFGNSQKGRLNAVKKFLEENENSFCLNQYSNESAFLAHYDTTGKEICNELNDITHLVGAISTGSTLLGTAKKIKERYPSVKVIAVDSEASSIFVPAKEHSEINGIGSSFQTEIFKRHSNLLDGFRVVCDQDAFKHVTALANKDAIFCGYSSGCVMKTMLDIDKEEQGCCVVGIIADQGEYYYDQLYKFGMDPRLVQH